jgi:methylenetetrahydrofolate dehydrogenase (NADP+)/methenyltetrahydrofolate cyclohydrolase
MSVSEQKILEGKFLAREIREDIKTTIEKLVSDGKDRPSLLALQASDDPSSAWYIGQQEKWAEKLGIRFEKIGADVIKSQEDLLRILAEKEKEFHGVFIAMPLPKSYDAEEVMLAMDAKKDVEGIHPTSLGLIVLRKSKLIPPTAYAAFRLIESTEVELRGKKAAIVGQSAIVGRPLQLLLGERRVTTTVCNTGTSEADLAKIIGESDIVIGCAGQPKMIKGEWIREGAIVIDVGTTEVEGQLVGDVDFEGAKEKSSFITPVPGGVGPLTVTMLMKNLMNAYAWQQEG